MSNIVQSPPFLFTYWNPLAKDSNVVGSWFDYVRDTSLAKYTADSVGRYVQQASSNQISAIDTTGRKICGKLHSGFSGIEKQLKGISAQLGQVTNALHGVNQRLDLLHDEAITSNLLQENMAELLRIPDSQKQRQHHIEMALKFLKNALKEESLYYDALRELIEAEKLMPTDYFVLHRIGMIYLYVPALGNLEKAVDYFAKAGKYAAVESDPQAARLSNFLSKQVNKRFRDQADPGINEISNLAAESFYQCGSALYALGRFEDAAIFAEKAVRFQPKEAKYYFFLSKYLIRTGRVDESVKHLRSAILLVPEMSLAAVGDFDLNQEQPVLDLLCHLTDEVDEQLRLAINTLHDWPQSGHQYQKIEKNRYDAPKVLESGNYAEKASQLTTIHVLQKLEEIATFGVDFDDILAEQLLREDCPDHVKSLVVDRRSQYPLVVNKLLKELVKKPAPSHLELVLLATAKNCFVKPNSIRWKSEIAISNIAICEDGIIIGASEKNVHALDGQTGREIWSFETGGEVQSCPAIGYDGTIYIGSHDNKIYALDKQTGEKLWHLSTRDIVRTSFGISARGIIYVGSGSKIIALHGQTGSKLWDFKTGNAIKSSPAISQDGTVYFGSDDHNVYALDGQTGRKLWSFETGGEVQSSPAIGENGMVYVGSYDNKVYALDKRSGKKRWDFTTKNWVRCPLVIGTSDTLYVGSCQNRVYSLDGKSGKLLWEFNAGSEVLAAPVVAQDGTLYVGSYNGILFALDGQTGRKMWDLSLIGGIQFHLNLGSDGTLYVAEREKALYAIWTASDGPAKSSWPMFQQNARRTGTDLANADNIITSLPINKEPKQRIKKEIQTARKQNDEIKSLMAEAKSAEKKEKSKWFWRKDFTRARELYTQAAALGSKDAAKKLEQL